MALGFRVIWSNVSGLFGVHSGSWDLQGSVPYQTRLNHLPQRDHAFVGKIQKIRANMFGTELVGRLVEVFCELGNGLGVVANRAFGEVAQPEIFLHALA